MQPMNSINVGIGFVTGRKSFKHLINTYVHNWNENGLVSNERIGLHLLVAYDLKYSQTKATDYTNIDPEIASMLDTISFIDEVKLQNERKQLIKNGILNQREIDLLFGEGYGKKRNIILYYALKKGFDYLIFIDDDEYPMAAIKNNEGYLRWKGQKVLVNHLKYIPEADLTYGYHCGYISPIPCLKFDDTLTEIDFKTFIEAISNDIISWESLKQKMASGGITYADPQVFNHQQAFEIPEENGAKFISGSNLCFNLNRIERLAPFYNPPGARGEDTFLSTCLSQARVLKVPCYTFHDGFSRYIHLLHGVLPESLRPVTAISDEQESQGVINRFLKAAIGWARYKPLLLLITKPAAYHNEIKQAQEKLGQVLPKFTRRFQNSGFNKILNELTYYHRNVQNHFKAFTETKQAWQKLVAYLKNEDSLTETDSAQLDSIGLEVMQ